MNVAHTLLMKHRGKSVRAARDTDSGVSWQPAVVIGAFDEKGDLGVVVRFRDGEIQQVPLQFVHEAE